MEYRNSVKRHEGFTLFLVVAIIGGIFLTITALLMSASFARHTTQGQLTRLDEKFASDSIREIAFASLEASTNSDHYIVHVKNSQNEKDPSYTIVSSFDKEELKWKHQPLVSGKEFFELETNVAPGSLDQWEVEPSIFPELPEKESEETVTLSLSGDSGETVERVLSAYPLASFQKDRVEIKAGYWVEDLGGKIDFEACFASTQEDEEGKELRTPFDPYLLSEMTSEQRERFLKTWNEVQPRQVAHFDLNSLLSAEESTSYDFFNPIHSEGEKHFLSDLLAKDYPPYSLDRETILEGFSVHEKELLNRHFSFGLDHTKQRQVVPFGHDHLNAGESQYSLNQALFEIEKEDDSEELKAKVVEEIAEQVEKATAFSQESELRRGGFDLLHSYPQTLAANLLDYADQDSQSTCAWDNKSLFYRGVEAMPFITEHGQRFLMIGNDGGPIIEVRHFVELCNPCNLPVRGFCGLEVETDYTLGKYRDRSGIKKEFPDFVDPNPDDQNSQRRLFYHKGAIEIPANSYRVLEFKESFSERLSADAEFENSICLFEDTGAPIARPRINKANNNHLRLFWKPSEKAFETLEGFALADGITRGSFKRPSYNSTVRSTADENRAPVWSNSLYISARSPFADPRATLYNGKLEQPTASYYGSVSYGGQNKLTYNDLKTDFNTTPDILHNHQEYGTVPDREGGNYQYLPGENGYVHFTEEIDAPRSKIIEANHYPTGYYEQEENSARALYQISNRGYYWSLGELGCIFDPAQWENLHRPNDETGSATESLTATADEQAGGGLTLAIGSSEMTYFKEQEMESARLLDQFTISPTAFESLKGKVNLNTASEKVLRALFSGYVHSDDRVYGSFTRLPRSENSQKVVSAMVEAILSRRKQRPFLSLSDIALLETENGIPVFGEKSLYQQPLTFDDGVDEEEVWSDYGREELFRKTNHLFATTSRAFRVHTVVQFSENDEERTIQSSYDVTLHPRRSEDGLVDREQRAEIRIHHKTKKTL